MHHLPLFHSVLANFIDILTEKLEASESRISIDLYYISSDMFEQILFTKEFSQAKEKAARFLGFHLAVLKRSINLTMLQAGSKRG